MIEYCERHGDDYDIIWWVPAEELALVPDRLAELSRAINVAGDTETVVSAVSRLRTELAQRRRWLIIFDNAEDPAALGPHLVRGPGHTLITSRNPSWEDFAVSASMKVLDRAESIELVKKRLPQIGHRDADRIASAVNDLSLALSQAAAYLADTGMAADSYVDLLASRATEVLAEGKPGNYPVSFASGLRIALEAIMADRPPAVELLTLAAFMAPEPIPLALFSAHPAMLSTSLGGRDYGPADICQPHTVAASTGPSSDRHGLNASTPFGPGRSARTSIRRHSSGRRGTARGRAPPHAGCRRFRPVVRTSAARAGRHQPGYSSRRQAVAS